jgi:glycerate 2-kinase
VRAITRAAIDASDPTRLLRQSLADGFPGSVSGTIRVIAAGKAASGMLRALAECVRIEAGVVSASTAPSDSIPGVVAFETGHPLPNAASEQAGAQALALARATRGTDVLVVLLSGGASAMLCAPAERISREEKAATTDVLMRAGGSIEEINCVRKHLSRLKGGQLAALATRTVTYALSDVHAPVPDDPAVIGSGPTVPDETTYGDALRVIAGRSAVPASVVRYLERGARGEIGETPKPGDARLRNTSYVLIGNRHTALDAALRAAQDRGYTVAMLPEPTLGEARDAATAFIAGARGLAADGSRPLCVLAAGETTVTVTGDGRGGRNQEFTLATVCAIGGFGRAAALASVGTDGIDGPTDAAGAIADSTTLERARRRGLDWRGALGRNDAYGFFEPLGDLIRWGPTGTNVGDLQVMLIA